MNALANLKALLAPVAAQGARPWRPVDGMDEVIKELEGIVKGQGSRDVPEDIRLDAVKRFWERQEIRCFRDAYLLSWGLVLPHQPKGPCILEDHPRLQRVLDGVDNWKNSPSWFRSCYHGLIKSYFTYDTFDPSAPAAGRENWKVLRNYLSENITHIRDVGLNPDWVEIAMDNRRLFGPGPCEPYAQALLHGDSREIDRICEPLGIDKASWFFTEIVLAQINRATQLPDPEYQTLLPRLLAMLLNNKVLRDRGMIEVLDRYARVAGAPRHQELSNRAMEWWGNPWLPSNKSRWGGVRPETKAMVADWLKLEFIETFFTKLAEDGLGDSRRLEFWKRYVKAIDHIEFALGSFARDSDDHDFEILRKKMKGLLCKLEAPGTNNAFIMRMGSLVAVEFSGKGNAFYGYDARQSLPFDTTKALRLDVNGLNSLKDKRNCIIRLRHKDDAHHHQKWEDIFQNALKDEFSIFPNIEPVPRSSATSKAGHTDGPTHGMNLDNARGDVASGGKVGKVPSIESGQPPAVKPPSNISSVQVNEPYSLGALNRLSREYGFTVNDLRGRGGNLWAYTDTSNPTLNRFFLTWGFKYKLDKGWWK